MSRRSIVLAITIPLLAQEQPSFRADVNLVRVPCIVSSADGAPIQGLRADEFVVREDGVRQNVKYLWQEVDLPLTAVVVVDVSCSQLKCVTQHKRSVSLFLERVFSLKDRAALVAVNHQARLVADLTNSLETLRSRSAGLDEGESPVLGRPCIGARPGMWASPGQPCGDKPLWNAVYFSAKLGLQSQRGRKAILLLTDGLDTGSDYSFDEALAACQSANAVVYSIRHVTWMSGYMSSGISKPWLWGKPALERIAHDTGGTAFDAGKDEIAAIFDRIETDLRNQYVLGYTPSKAQGGKGYRRLAVKVTRPGLTVRAQERYYMR